MLGSHSELLSSHLDKEGCILQVVSGEEVNLG